MADFIEIYDQNGIKQPRVSGGGGLTDADYGDIVVSGGGTVMSIDAGVIVNADVNAAAAIALSKLATQAAHTFVANATAGAAVPTAISIATAMSELGAAASTETYVTISNTAGLSAERALAVGSALSLTDGGANASVTLDRAALTGDVTAGAGSNATTIAARAVTVAKFQAIATQRVLGRSSVGSGDVEEHTVDGLTISGGVLSVTSASGTFAFTGDGANATTGSQNNVVVAGQAVHWYTGAGTATYTGIAGGSDGRVLFIGNRAGAGNTLTLSDDNASSTNVNRIALNGDITLDEAEGALLVYYDAGTTASRWRCIGVYRASSGGGAPTTSDYLVKTADAGLSAERVVTDTTTVVADWGTAGQVKFNVQELDKIPDPVAQVDCNTQIFDNIIPAMAAGTASANSHPKWKSSTLLTTAEAGAVEYANSVHYATPNASNRGVICSKHFIRQAAGYTLTSTTSLQQIFNTSTNGTLTLPTGVYEFECMISMTSMSATSGNYQIDILGAGGATLAALLWYVVGVDGASAGTGNQSGGFQNTNATGTNAVSAQTATTCFTWAKGSFDVTGAGTIIPSVALVTAAAASVRPGSFFSCNRIGATGVTTCGNWS